MKTRLAITDLTRMQRGMVCIAGYDEKHRCVRPILPYPGIAEKSLIQGGRAIVYPFAIVELDLLEARPQPPHTEDYCFEAGSPRFVRTIKDREELLRWSLFDTVEEIFEQPIHDDLGYYVMDCQGPRSVGTLRPDGIARVLYEQGPEGVWDYRLMFFDRQDRFFRLKITDLTWHYFCDSQRKDCPEPKDIAARLTALLKSSKVYLRIGLARGWRKFPERCYLQINGIYTFPDYLGGKTFADLAEA